MSSEVENSSNVIAEWKQRREVELNERDEADERAKGELKEEAIKHIDEFYENYNRKKSEQLEGVRREAEEFQKNRDEFSSQEGTTTWDRVLQLINEDDADQVAGRDKSKFKEILQRLKGNTAAPGA
ncbi:clathrin light chain [Zygosaccharomyces mellis]|uniref:Clathrin light chain n=1 Tax=Zygosaccharomyces mellis TaxID=42258 RepID=A0A4C2EB08_9SACH|nr:clathrin light chain [Zygosaccharomyces mellis]